MSFDPLRINLPVIEIIPSFWKHLVTQNTILVTAPPGAGKSTLLPLALLNQNWLQGKKIIMLEPRRLAAKTIAMRMASLLEEEVGQSVGYRIRFENKIGKHTQIEVVTEGILTRMLQSDNALEDYAAVIFDEFHERSLHADLALALCREAQQVIRPDLRIIVMSATLNLPSLSEKLQAPVLTSLGKQYPVNVLYREDAQEQFLPELTARTVVQSVAEFPGDALVFLPGEAEIRKCEELLIPALNQFAIHALYGQLSPQEQMRAIMPNREGKRKIVLATSIAETSLTIEGVQLVIDSGFTRTSRFDSRSGLSRLETIRISKDSADQRAGRAGRLSAGVCVRMWTQATQQRLAENRSPEILEADLCSLMLDLAVWGVPNINTLLWLNEPPKSSVQQAVEILTQIGALNNQVITPHGKRVHALACHPRLAHMLIMAGDKQQQALGTDLAALLEERDPLGKEAGTDINLRIEALRRWRKNNNQGGRFFRIEKVAAYFRQLLNLQADNSPVDSHSTGLLLAYAYPERIASARPGNNAQFQLSNGKYAMIGHQDDLAHEPWLAVAQMDLREGMGKIFLASPLQPKDLLHLVKEQEVITWDTRRGGLIATKELRIGNLSLQSKALPHPGEQAVTAVICEAIKNEGENLLQWDESMQQLQARLLSLKVWNPNEIWPDVNTSELLADVGSWLGPYLGKIKSVEELKKINVHDALLHALPWEQQQLLQQLAPPRIEVPSGSKIPLRYFPNGNTPVLAVRLQEVFGMDDTPSVNAGKTKMVLHLLSPGYKPVQVTSDLKSFWNNLYHEVRSELKRKYPKHAWPEDPWTAQAVAKGKSTK